MKNKLIRSGIGVVAGAAVGFLIYSTIGCSGGSCPITGNPYMSILWGSVTGLLIAHS